MTSLIDHAVLTLLGKRPMYGYELNEQYERWVGDLVPTSQGNLYEVLKRLQRAGYVDVERVGGTRGRPRIYHSVTREGAAVSRAWLVEQLREDPRRLELFIRLSAAGLSDPQAAREALDLYEEQAAREARQIALPGWSMASSNPHEELLAELLIEQKRRVAAAQLEWVAYARARISERLEGPPTIPTIGGGA